MFNVQSSMFKVKMRRVFYFSVCVALVFSACKAKQNAIVQVHEKENIPFPTPQPPKGIPQEKPKDTIQLKNEINIALLLLLYLEDNFKIDTSDTEPEIDSRSLPALSFYEGALLAKDSLEKTGIKINL